MRLLVIVLITILVGSYLPGVLPKIGIVLAGLACAVFVWTRPPKISEQRYRDSFYNKV